MYNYICEAGIGNMVRPRDKCWEHAKKLPKRQFQCNYCGLKFGGGATRIKSHLSQLKGGDIQICTKVPDHVRLAADLAIDPHDHGSFNKKTKKSRASSSSSSSQTERSHKRNLLHPDDDDTKLAKLMILHNIPIAAAKAILSDEFVKCVADFRSKYQHPLGRETLERQMKYDIPKQAEEYTKDAEESLLQTGCTLIFHLGYEILYASTSKGLLFMGKLPLNDDDDDDDDCNKWLLSKVQSLEPNNILQLIINCENADLDEEIVKKVFIDYPWVWVTCCAIEQITNFFHDVSSNQCSLTTCATLVFLYMEKNHPSLLSLREGRSSAQSSSIVALANNLIKDSYWMYHFVIGFLRLKSLLEFEDKLQALQLPPVHLSNDSRFFYYVIKHREFWIRGKQVVHALHPLFETFCLLISNNNVTVGYLYPLMQRANILIQRFGSCCFRDCIRTNFNEMYKTIIGPIHAAGALLNPAYLCSEDYNEENKDMKEGINFVLENIVGVEERDDFMSQLITYQFKEPKLFTPSARALLNTSHPGVWWKYCGDCVPVLKKYALKIVSQPCSSLLTYDDWKSINIDDLTDGELKTKMIMMEKSVTPKAHHAEATKLVVDQLVALHDVEPYCSQYDFFFHALPGLNDGKFWDSLEDPSISFLDNHHSPFNLFPR